MAVLIKIYGYIHDVLGSLAGKFQQFVLHWVPVGCHINIWQASPQILWGDVCLIWWLKETYTSFRKVLDVSLQ